MILSPIIASGCIVFSWYKNNLRLKDTIYKEHFQLFKKGEKASIGSLREHFRAPD
jgi:hypothetical protein